MFAVHALSFLGISPIAALVSGAIAEAAGPTVAGSITGGFAFVAAIILVAFRDELEQEPVKATEMPEPSL